MNEQMLKEIEAMTDAEKEQLLNTEFPEELEKEAAAELAMQDLADAVYTYGYLTAERSLAETDGIDKVASENLEAHDGAVAETEEVIEALVEGIGFAEIEDEAEFHKHAQGLAQFMFEGYTDCMDKVAAAKGKPAIGVIKRTLGKVSDSLAKHKKGTVKMIRRHPGKSVGGSLALGAALGGGAGYVARGHMDKKASELTAAELIDGIAEAMSINAQANSEFNDVVNEGVEKLAARGNKKAMGFFAKHLDTGKKLLTSGMNKTKAVYKNQMKAHGKAYAGGAGFLAGTAAGVGGKHLYDNKKND